MLCTCYLFENNVFLPKIVTIMQRNIFAILLISLLSLTCPIEGKAMAAMEFVDNTIQNISLTITDGSAIRVSGANGETMKIFNIAGVCVKSIKIEGDEKQFNLNLPKGCYIVKIGKFVRKISVR